MKEKEKYHLGQIDDLMSKLKSKPNVDVDELLL